MLGMMYGSKGFSPPAHAMATSTPHSIPRTHPLEFDSQYSFEGREPMFGNVPVYKVVTKLTSQIICSKQKIPHTCVHYRMLDDLSSWVDPNVAALVWTRATPMDQLEQAVATAIMMGHTPVLLRAFKP